MAEARVDLLVPVSPHGVDRAVAACHGMDERLARPQPDLVAPIGPLLVRALGRAQLQAAADVGDACIGERRDQLAQGIGLPLAVGVRERQHVHVGERAHGHVLGVHLPAARRAHELDPPLGEAPHDLVRVVARGVRGDDDAQELARVVQRKRVLELGGDHVVLVVGRDHERDARPEALVGTRRARAQARERRDEDRVERVRPDEGGERRPEDHFEDEHRARVVARSTERPYSVAAAPPRPSASSSATGRAASQRAASRYASERGARRRRPASRISRARPAAARETCLSR